MKFQEPDQGSEISWSLGKGNKKGNYQKFET